MRRCWGVPTQAGKYKNGVAMTVAELIDILKEMPQSASVTFRLYSEVAPMTKEDIELVNNRILRNGTYIKFREEWWDFEKDGQPEFETIVLFPGN